WPARDQGSDPLQPLLVAPDHPAILRARLPGVHLRRYERDAAGSPFCHNRIDPDRDRGTHRPEPAAPHPDPPAPFHPPHPPAPSPGAGGSRVARRPPLGAKHTGLGAVAAFPPAAVWAVRNFLPHTASSNQDANLTPAAHLDGKTWSAVPTPNAGPNFNTLFGV